MRFICFSLKLALKLADKVYMKTAKEVQIETLTALIKEWLQFIASNELTDEEYNQLVSNINRLADVIRGLK